MAGQAQVLVGGNGSGSVLYADEALSFWGGVDPISGVVIDSRHPLCGACLAGRVLAIPRGRGSCTGSQVMLELLLGGRAPAAVLLEHPDAIIALGVIVAEELFGRCMPVVSLGQEYFSQAATAAHAIVEEDGQKVRFFCRNEEDTGQTVDQERALIPCSAAKEMNLALTSNDMSMLEGAHGRAVKAAMRIVVRAATVQGAKALLDITQAHIDGCTYIGPASLRFAQKLVEWGGKVRVPTTLNAISVDQRRWHELGVPVDLGEPASALGDAYVTLGAQKSFTCAPYLLDGAPSLGEQVAWGESNAVVFANSVLGARTQKYADFLDICIALTGRAPLSGCHLDEWRKASLVLVLPPLSTFGHLDDSFYPTLGYLCGLRAGARVPVVAGLEAARPNRDNLKAFCAAFGTTGSAAMVHIAGITPEAPDVAAAVGGDSHSVETCEITLEDLRATWQQLDASCKSVVDLVSLGNPHFSLEECLQLAELCQESRKSDNVAMVVTMSRSVLAAAHRMGFAAELQRFGAELVTDTCWCMLNEPVVPPTASTIITNSAKFAHYGPGLLQRDFRFASLAGCVTAARSGRAPVELPMWLNRTAVAQQARSFSTARLRYGVGSTCFWRQCCRLVRHLG